MVAVREAVTLHPETVTKGEKLAKERRKRGPRKPEPEVTRHYKKRPPWMNQAVWAVAITLADKDHKRVIIESPTSALVVNG